MLLLFSSPKSSALQLAPSFMSLLGSLVANAPQVLIRLVIYVVSAASGTHTAATSAWTASITCGKNNELTYARWSGHINALLHTCMPGFCSRSSIRPAFAPAPFTRPFLHVGTRIRSCIVHTTFLPRSWGCRTAMAREFECEVFGHLRFPGALTI